jgi:hypothetical protein
MSAFAHVLEDFASHTAICLLLEKGMLHEMNLLWIDVFN